VTVKVQSLNKYKGVTKHQNLMRYEVMQFPWKKKENSPQTSIPTETKIN